MEGVLNVREPLVVGTVTVPGAVGDGCHDDSDRIQARLNALVRAGAVPGTCGKDDSGDSWPTYAAAVYFPAGVYRITKPLRVPYAHGFRLFGDVPGRYAGDPAVPLGSFLRQDTTGAPILVFGDVAENSHAYIWGWDIEGLGFTWATQQEAPPNWAYRRATESLAPGYAESGAVAILFTGPRTNSVDRLADFYHGRIARCTFGQGWRGIAIDETHGATISVWDTHIEDCKFSSFRGAAISYINGPGAGGGMPNNSIVNTFVENYGQYNDIHRNEEEQFRVSAQSAMHVGSLALEGSRTTLLYADSSSMVVSGLHIENVDIRTQYPRLLYLIGSGHYLIRAMSVDGVMWAQNPTDPSQRGLSILVTALGQADVTLEGVGALPHDPSISDPQQGGLIPLVGPAFLFEAQTDSAGRQPTIYLRDRPRMPVYSAAQRAAWVSPYPAALGVTYEALYTYSDDYVANSTARVRAPEAKVEASVTLLTVVNHSVQTVTVPLPGAKAGDVVRMGLPAAFPALLMVTAVAVSGAVELRLANPTETNYTGGAQVTVVLAVGGGPNAGAPQPL